MTGGFLSAQFAEVVLFGLIGAGDKVCTLVQNFGTVAVDVGVEGLGASINTGDNVFSGDLGTFCGCYRFDGSVCCNGYSCDLSRHGSSFAWLIRTFSPLWTIS